MWSQNNHQTTLSTRIVGINENGNTNWAGISVSEKDKRQYEPASETYIAWYDWYRETWTWWQGRHYHLCHAEQFILSIIFAVLYDQP